MRKLICAFVPILSCGYLLHAQTGSLDNTFNRNGKVITPVGTGNETARDIAIQKDGKIVVAGTYYNVDHYEFVLLRYNTDGSNDNSFNEGGKVTTRIGAGDAEVNAVTVQTDGKILAAGFCVGTYDDFCLVRYNNDGSPDKTFGKGGIVTTSFSKNSDDAISGIALQSDQKILVIGYTSVGNQYDFAIARYNSDGTPDMSFDGDGKQTTDIGQSTNDFAFGIAIQTDEKIVAAGYTVNQTRDFALVRYNKDGSLDQSFATAGKQITDMGTASNDKAFKVAVQGDGKIVLAGTVNAGNNNFGIARYNTDGSPDTGFGNKGIVITGVGASSSADNELNALDIQNDNKIVVAGFSDAAGDFNFIVARYTTNGVLDNSFNNSGIVSTDITLGQSDYAYAVKLYGPRIYLGGYVKNLGNAEFAVTALKNDAPALILNFSHLETKMQYQTCILNWSTEQEWRVNSFDVERSGDGMHFTSIGQVSTENERISSNYSFTDKAPFSTINYYRLLIKDADGRNTYSKVVTAAFSRGLQIFPIPAYDVLQVKLPDGLNRNTKVQIFDISGKLVISKPVQLTGSSITVPINVRGLPKGVYVINVPDTGPVLVQRFIKLEQ